MSGWLSLSNLRWYFAHFLQHGFLSSSLKIQASSLSFVACVVSFQCPLGLHTACPQVFFSMNSCSLLLLFFWGCPNRRSDDSLHPFLPFHLFRPIWGRCTTSSASLFHSLLSLHSSVPPSFSLILSISLSLSKGRSTKSNNGKMAQVNHSEYSFSNNLKKEHIG